MKKRICIVLLALTLVLSGFSGQESGEQDSNLPSEHILPVKKGDTVRFGGTESGPIEWLVLDGQEDSTGRPGMFLLTRHMLELFGISYGSSAEEWCSALYQAAFTDAEKGIISEVNKSETAISAFGQDWESSMLTGAHVFFLSAKELLEYVEEKDFTAYSADGAPGYWWLRSLNGQGEAGLVRDNNAVSSGGPSDAWGARPAIDLATENILLAVPADADISMGAVLPLADSEARNWELALLDEDRDFSIGDFSVEDGMITAAYYGAEVGENEYISILIRDADGQDCLYGRLLQPESPEGSLTLDTSAFTMPENGRLYFFSEHDNASGSGSLASSLCELTCTLTIDAGEGAAEIEPIVASYGATIALPEGIFFTQPGQEFDHWELNGAAVQGEIVLTSNAVLKAVYSQVEAAAIQFDKPRLVLMLFESQDIHASGAPEGAVSGDIIWTIEDESLAELTDNGDGTCSVKAKRPGETVITAATEDGSLKAEVEVSVIGSAFRAFVMNNLLVVLSVAAVVFAVALYLTIKRPSRKKKRRRRHHHHHHHHHHTTDAPVTMPELPEGQGKGTGEEDKGSEKDALPDPITPAEQKGNDVPTGDKSES